MDQGEFVCMPRNAQNAERNMKITFLTAGVPMALTKIRRDFDFLSVCQ
jgi:hypothetical protein